MSCLDLLIAKMERKDIGCDADLVSFSSTTTAYIAFIYLLHDVHLSPFNQFTYRQFALNQFDLSALMTATTLTAMYLIDTNPLSAVVTPYATLHQLNPPLIEQTESLTDSVQLWPFGVLPPV
jgi:hypothetical protein